MAFLSINQLSFSYPNSPEPLFNSLSLVFEPGWNGIIGANGSGKSTLLQLITQENSTWGGISKAIGGPNHRVYCPQVELFHQDPSRYYDFFHSWDPVSLELFDHLNLDFDWYYRWESLSFGERKRVQIAFALWQNPDVLALDEPTNHLDQPTKEILLRALAPWKGIGLLVSHDRDFLDSLCHRCVFLSIQEGQTEATVRPGTFSQGLEQEQREQKEYRRKVQNQWNRQSNLVQELHRRKELQDRANSSLRKKTLDKKDHDTKARIDAARISGKDRRGGDSIKRMSQRVQAGQDNLQAISGFTSTFGQPPKPLSQEATQIKADWLARMEQGTIRFQEGGFSLRHPELILKPQDRIGLSGPNGSGKSTLVQRLISAMNPDIPRLIIPQELSEDDLNQTWQRYLNLDDSKKGLVLAQINHLGTNPQRLRASSLPSPGEVRKLLLCLGLLSRPGVIILDEPTNHLDLPSVVGLEKTLLDFKGCILMVSHDQRFLASTTSILWDLTDGFLKIS